MNVGRHLKLPAAALLAFCASCSCSMGPGTQKESLNDRVDRHAEEAGRYKVITTDTTETTSALNRGGIRRIRSMGKGGSKKTGSPRGSADHSATPRVHGGGHSKGDGTPRHSSPRGSSATADEAFDDGPRSHEDSSAQAMGMGSATRTPGRAAGVGASPGAASGVEGEEDGGEDEYSRESSTAEGEFRL